MSDAELRQRLVAILAADVAGYSRLMSVDERATVAALDAARAVFRGDYRPFHRPEHMTMLLDSLRKAGLAS